MKIMIDTNILISAALFPGGQASQALFRALAPPYEPMICDYIVDELQHVFRKKFPAKTAALQSFLSSSASIIKVVKTPEKPNIAEQNIRDVKDRPILRAAIAFGADYLLTGDKDFFDASIQHPCVISVATFLQF